MARILLWNPLTLVGDFGATAPSNWTDANDGLAAAPPVAGDVAVFGGSPDNLAVTITGTEADELNIVAPIDGPGPAPLFFISGSLTTNGFLFLIPTEVFVDTGGLLNVSGALATEGTASSTIDISGFDLGGKVELGSLLVGEGGISPTNMTFNFIDNPGVPNTGVIQFDSGFTVGSEATQVITGVTEGDKFVIGDADFTGDTVDYNGTTLTVMNGATTEFTMTNVTAIAGTTFVASGDVITAGPVCYVRGTMIRTPTGELPVEKLRPGKQVIALVDGAEVPQTVTWLGHRRISLAAHPRPETVAPIRIERDAIADGMPHRDLLVSPDHAIYVGGMLICARQLMNGTTIRQERDWTAVDYYHVELDQHAILLAEGLPAESYIDTGNSGFFANSGAPMVLHPDLTDETDYPTREAGSCAPFVSDEASVQPIWQRLFDRAAAIGRAVPVRMTTADADLRLCSKRTGRRTYEPIYSDSNLVIFMVPSRSLEVQLLSRAQSPTEVRPWLEDRRHLGVRVKRIVLRSANDLREIPVDHPDLASGWWAVERDSEMMARWTDGKAVLPLPAMQGPVMLEIHLAGSMTYAVDAAPEDATERRAAA